MKNSRSLRLGFVMVTAFILAASMTGSYAQTVSTIESGNYCTAIANDKNNNLYVIRYNAAGPTYELVKYIGGTGSPVLLYTGLNYDAQDFPWGVVVTSNGDIYIAASNADNKLIKLTYNSGTNSYTASDFATGNYYSALALDKDENLYTCEYVASNNDYAVVKYPAGSNTGTRLFEGLLAVGSYSTGLCVAQNGDIYVTDGFNGQTSNFGAVYKVTAASGYNFAAKTTISSGKYSTSLALDPAGNLYVSEYDGSSTFVLNEYKNGGGAPIKQHDLLINAGDFYPWGIIAYSDKDIYFSTGNDAAGSGGSLLHLLADPTTQASNIAFSNIDQTSATVNWVNGSSRARAVFMANATTGTPAPVNGTTYAANAAFGTGAQIGASGWFCIYNGTAGEVDVTGLAAGATYRVMVIDYNGAAGEQQYFTSTATNNPSNITLPATVPVSWTIFNITVKDNSYTWHWELGVEENVAYYTPEYSSDGVHYINAGKVSELNAQHKYTFTALLTGAGQHYFRVKATDKDGNFKYSDVRSLKADDPNKLVLYPNPATTFINIQWPFKDATSAEIMIGDTQGRIIRKQKATLSNGTLKLSVTGLATGIYFMTIRDNQGHESTSGQFQKK